MGPRTGARVGLVAVVTSGALLVSACAGGGTDHDPAASATTTSSGTAATTDAQTDAAVDDLPRATPRSQGLSRTRLKKAARVAKQARSSCFVVLRRGKVVGEWNWDVPSTFPREVFSTTKSVTSALVGIAVRDGDLRLDDPVSRYVPQWQGTPSEGVTVRHILSNTSGRYWTFQSDYRDLVQAPNRTEYAIGLTQQFPPGTSWQYNNAAIQVLEAVLEKATGMPVARFAKQRLFKPLGMDHTHMITDRKDNAATFYGLRTTCLDIARFGLLYLGGGKFRGKRILPGSYVEQSIGRSSSQLNAAYGLLWWLNRPGVIRGATDALQPNGQPSETKSGQLMPGVSQRAFAAIGLGGQIMLVDPTTRTIVIRQGQLAQAGQKGYALGDAAKVLP